jgi:hypothetical protein
MVLNVKGQWFVLAFEISEVLPSHLPVIVAFGPSNQMLV